MVENNNMTWEEFLKSQKEEIRYLKNDKNAMATVREGFERGEGEAGIWHELKKLQRVTPNDAVRDEIRRMYARYRLNPETSDPMRMTKGTPEDILTDYSPGNAFFNEMEKVVGLYLARMDGAYKIWEEKTEPLREEWLKNGYKDSLAQRGSLAIRNAWSDEKESIEKIKTLTNDWERLESNGLLSNVVNMGLSSKFMEEVKKNPVLQAYLPAKLVDNLATRWSAPFYNEVRAFYKTNPEEFQKFFLAEKYLPKEAENKLKLMQSAATKLKNDAEWDLKLRSNPEKADIINQRRAAQRAQSEKNARGTSQHQPKVHKSASKRSDMGMEQI